MPKKQKNTHTKHQSDRIYKGQSHLFSAYPNVTYIRYILVPFSACIPLSPTFYDQRGTQNTHTTNVISGKTNIRQKQTYWSPCKRNKTKTPKHYRHITKSIQTRGTRWSRRPPPPLPPPEWVPYPIPRRCLFLADATQLACRRTHAPFGRGCRRADLILIELHEKKIPHKVHVVFVLKSAKAALKGLKEYTFPSTN